MKALFDSGGSTAKAARLTTPAALPHERPGAAALEPDPVRGAAQLARFE